MKQEKPSTFILNRNDKQYFLVEGNSNFFTGAYYNMFYNKNEKPVYYTPERFVEIHSLDEKLKIEDFARQALLNLNIFRGTDKEIDKTYAQLYSVYMQVSGASNAKSPSLSSSNKTNLLEALEKYNEIKSKFYNEIEISYEEDYKLVTPEHSRKLNNVKTIESYQNEQSQLENENIKGIQRVRREAA